MFTSAQFKRTITLLEAHGRHGDAMALKAALGVPTVRVTGPLAYPGSYPAQSPDGRYRVLSYDRQPHTSAMRREPKYFAPANPHVFNLSYIAWINALGTGGTWLEWV